jgi:hypothetical protein
MEILDFEFSILNYFRSPPQSKQNPCSLNFFGILSPVSKNTFELIDLERDEDFSLYHTRPGYYIQD